MRYPWMIISVVFTMLIPAPSWSHGTRGITEKAQAVRVLARYDDDAPMSYAAVDVTAPDSDLAFQTGRTDRNGVFVFAPDRPGKWRVSISDGLGHRLVLSHMIDPGQSVVAESVLNRKTGVGGGSHREGVVVGLSVIFGFYGLFYGWRARRQ